MQLEKGVSEDWAPRPKMFRQEHEEQSVKQIENDWQGWGVQSSDKHKGLSSIPNTHINVPSSVLHKHSSAVEMEIGGFLGLQANQSYLIVELKAN